MMRNDNKRESSGSGRAVLWVIALSLSALFALQPLAFAGKAQARSLFDIIFGKRKEPEIRPRPPVTQTKKRKPATQAAKSTAPAEEPAVEKTADARKILVVGDFMASALADGLTAAFANEPGIVIDKETDGSSGLVRKDHLDWPARLKTMLADINPSVVVVMLGSNDRQQMTVDGVKEKFQSDKWNGEYEKRVVDLIEASAQSRIPLVWTGLPSFQSPSLSSDMSTLNNLFRTKTEEGGGIFIDVWDGFADENGKFVATGSDINGQPVRLRGSDGLSLTKAGKRKLAFYLEKDLRRLAGVSNEATAGALDLSSLRTGFEQPETLKDIVTVPPISLADPELDGISGLMDSALLPRNTGATPRDLLIEKGETIKAPSGRIDDFTLKPAG